MNESLTITLPKNMPLIRRISEISRRINEWLNSFDVAFNNEKDKLHLKKIQIKSKEYLYIYSIISRKGLSVGAVNSRGDSSDSKTPANPVTNLEIKEPLAEFSHSL